MWGSQSDALHPRQTMVPDSLDDDEGLQVVYGDQSIEEVEEAEGRAGRSRYVLAQASSAVKPTALRQSISVAGPSAGPLQGSPPPQHGAVSPNCNSPAGLADQPPLTLAQELQTILNDLTQQQGQQAQQQAADSQQHHRQQQQAQEPAAAAEEAAARGQRRRSGVVRQIRHNSPAVPPPSQLPDAEQHPSGRRWRRPQPAAGPLVMAPRQQQFRATQPASEAAAAAGRAAAVEQGAGARGGGSFFDVDADLLQAHARQRALQAAEKQHPRRRPQPRTVQWDSPQAAAPSSLSQLLGPPQQQQQQQQAGPELTPVPSQRPNLLASMLGSVSGNAGSAQQQRAATTGSRVRGRHPIYGAAAGTAPGSAAAAGTSSDGRVRELGLGHGPLTSPRQLAGRRRQQPQQHSRFAIRDPAAAGTAGVAADDGQPAAPAEGPAVDNAAAGGMALADGIRRLTGGEPGSALRRQQQFQPRPERPPSPVDTIEDEEEEEEQQQQLVGQQQDLQWQPRQHHQWGQQQGQAGPAHPAGPEAPAPDSFHTPGQPLRRRQQLEQPEWQDALAGGSLQAGGAGTGAGAPPPTAERGSTGGKPVSLQRQFIAQLQPVSRPTAAATMQQQRQRLAGATGLYARLQAILAAERAGLAQSPVGGGVLSGPRLTVLSKELEANLTKCHCRCDQAAAEALGSPEVVALLQNRTAREVDTAPGSVLLLREPWRVVPVAGSQLPAVLCFAVSAG